MWIIPCLGILLLIFGTLIGFFGLVQNVLIDLTLSPKYRINKNGEEIDNSVTSRQMEVFGLICDLVGLGLLFVE